MRSVLWIVVVYAPVDHAKSLTQNAIVLYCPEIIPVVVAVVILPRFNIPVASMLIPAAFTCNCIREVWACSLLIHNIDIPIPIMNQMI